MNKNKRLTVVVPAYNAEKYIDKCISSLLCQDLTDYEIIVVNDGSTDRTQDIVSEMQLKDSHILLINQENKGLGGARNTGLRNASGDYIMFVDSDDYLEPNSLSILLDKIEKDKPEVLYANFTKVDIKGNPMKKTQDEMMVMYAPQVVDAEIFFSQYYSFICYAVLFVFKREFLIQNSFSFKENVYMEDAEGIPRILALAKRISMLDYPFYNYVQTPDSIMRDDTKATKRLKDYLVITRLMKEHRNSCISSLEIKAWFDEMISINVIMICNMVTKKGLTNLKGEVYKELKQLNVFPLKIKRMPLKYKIISSGLNRNAILTLCMLQCKNLLKGN